VALAGLLTALAHLPGRAGRPGQSGARKAALLGAAAAVMFGFVAAVIKELSTHLSQGLPGVFGNWSPYVLLLSGAVAMYLASNAFQAGSLAASQPGLTIVDPLVASALGAALFGERLDLHPWSAAGEVLALVTLVASVVLLSRSPLVREEKEAGAEASGDAPASPLVPVARVRTPSPVSFPAVRPALAEGSAVLVGASGYEDLEFGGALSGGALSLAVTPGLDRSSWAEPWRTGPGQRIRPAVQGGGVAVGRRHRRRCPRR
jgi:hypothetical protein